VGTSAEAAAISEPEPLRVGLVGCGKFAQVGYAPAFRRARSVRLVAVADPNRDRCRVVAPDAPGFDSAGALIAGSEAEAIVVATPVERHVEIAAEVADAGLTALVEKPPASSAEEATRLLELEPSPSIAFNRRFDGGLRDLRDRVPQAGQVELQLVFDRRGTWGSYSGDDPLLLDTGPHAVDLVRWLTGASVARLRARESRHGASIELELGEGRGTARVQIRTNRPYREVAEIRSNGSLVGRHAVGGALQGVLARVGRAPESPLVPSLTRQLDAFAASVRGQPSHDVGTAADGVAVMAAVDAARASAANSGEWHPIRTWR
jgi:predicted dehydrogenase